MAYEEPYVDPVDSAEDLGDLFDSSGSSSGPELGPNRSSATTHSLMHSFDTLKKIVHIYWREHSVNEALYLHYNPNDAGVVQWIAQHRIAEVVAMKVGLIEMPYLTPGIWLLSGPEALYIIVDAEQ